MFNWQQTDTLTFAMPDGSQRRMTFGSCTEYDVARYQAGLNRIWTYFRRKHDVDLLPAINAVFFHHNANDDQQDAVDLYYPQYLRLQDWAAVVTSLQKFERRQSDTDEWVEEETPSEFLHPATALNLLPPGVLPAAIEKANQLNPGVFNNLDSAKKAVRLIENETQTPNETTSTNGPKPSSKRKIGSSESTETISQD